MTDTTPTPPASTTRRWTRWLYPAGAMTGIAVGIFVIVAGLYLLFAHPNCCGAMNGDMPCCAAMREDMKKMMDGMKMPMGNMPNTPGMPSMSPMPSMPSMSPMPNMPMPTPGR